MMSFDEFQKYFLEHVLEYMPEKYKGCQIDMHEVLKINGPKLHGMCLKQENSPVAPIVYLEDLYEEQLQGNSVEAVLSQFAIKYEKESAKLASRIDLAVFLAADRGENITYQLINRQRNRELLKESPHMCLLDLAKVYYVQAGDTERARVTYDLMDSWGMSLKELDSMAMASVDKYMSPHLFALELFDEGIADTGDENHYFSSRQLTGNGAYCLSNKDRFMGAGTILVPGVMQELSEKFDGDFYIIPSSVHEVILVKKGGNMDARFLKEVLHDVNREVVKPEEYLGGQVYEFQREKGRIVISPELIKSEKER